MAKDHSVEIPELQQKAPQEGRQFFLCFPPSQLFMAGARGGGGGGRATSRGGRQGKGREGGSEPASERGKGAAGEAGGLCGGRRAKASLGSRQPPPPPHHPRAAGRLLLPLSQALGPWGSHARSGCRLAFPAAPPCEAAPRLAPPPPPPAPRARTPAARAGLVPHASPRRSLTPSAERPPDPAAAASRPCRGAAPRRAAPRTGFVVWAGRLCPVMGMRRAGDAENGPHFPPALHLLPTPKISSLCVLPILF